MDWRSWAFIPGPDDVTRVISSLDLHEIAEYYPADIAHAFLAYQGFELAHGAAPTWWEWKGFVRDRSGTP